MMESVKRNQKKGGGIFYRIIRIDMSNGEESVFAGNVKIAAMRLGIEEKKLRGFIGKRRVIDGFRYKFDK